MNRQTIRRLSRYFEEALQILKIFRMKLLAPETLIYEFETETLLSVLLNAVCFCKKLKN